MAGFCASSPNGSPGARARTVYRMTLIPKMLGIMSRRRRITYCRDIRPPAPPGRPSRFLVPVLNVPGVVVPAADVGGEFGVHRGNAWAGDDRDHDVVADHHVVQLDEHRGALDGVHFDLSGFVDLVILLVLPA